MKRILSSAAILLAVALSAEAVVRLTHADARLMNPLLSRMKTDELSLYKNSPDPQLIYELIPNAHDFLRHEAEITTNSFGFRDRQRSADKPKGTYRIICLGGDFTHGTTVSDRQTFPYQLEELLNKKYVGSFEVWNAGIRHGTPGYQVALATRLTGLYKPDLILFQTGDWGPRVFLPDADPAYYFDRNKELYTENLRFIPFPSNKAMETLFALSAAYRFLVVFLNNFILINPNNPMFNKLMNEEETLNFHYLQRYSSAHNKPPAIIFKSARFNESYLPAPEPGEFDLRPMLANCFSTAKLPEHVTREYFENAPPAHVYRWYADCVAKELLKRGCIKTR